jgi:glycerophosphoryl diester phosphodiesterase
MTTQFASAAAPAAAAAPAVKISAHRGGAGQWPQNSLLAFSNALAAGYEEIEADAWILADGHHAIYHDPTISATRCAGQYVGRKIWTLTMSQLAAIRCDGQPIPTEAQLLSLIARSPNTRTVLRLETKSYPGQPTASAANWAYRIGEQVVDAGLAARAVMEDFRWAGIAGYHAASRNLRASALIVAISHADVDQAAALGAYDVSYDAMYVTRSINAYIAKHHLVPTVWGLDPIPAEPGPPAPAVAAAARSKYAKAACAGVKVVITNYPALLTAYRPTVTCPS